MNTTNIDLVALDSAKNIVNLIIMDDMDWQDPKDHIDQIQEKILKYVSFIEDGSLNQKYPSVVGYEVMIRVVFEYQPNEEGLTYIQEARSTLDDTGFHLEFVNF